MSYKLKTAPASEPVTLAEAKLHLRVDGSTEDTLINSLVKAAREKAERYMNRSIMEQTWTYYSDTLNGLIELNRGDVRSITHVKYYDKNNAIQTLSNVLYNTDIISNPARITRAYNATYPEIYPRTNAVEIEFVAGFVVLPEMVKTAILLTVGHWYENREAVTGKPMNELPMGVRMILDEYRIFQYV